jgi:thioredoxin-like negative regulator of GroEL
VPTCTHARRACTPKKQARSPSAPPQVAEVGRQHLLLGQLPAAAFHFEAAQHADPLCAGAAAGLAECLAAQGRLEEAEQQLQARRRGFG